MLPILHSSKKDKNNIWHCMQEATITYLYRKISSINKEGLYNNYIIPYYKVWAHGAKTKVVEKVFLTLSSSTAPNSTQFNK